MPQWNPFSSSGPKQVPRPPRGKDRNDTSSPRNLPSHDLRPSTHYPTADYHPNYPSFPGDFNTTNNRQYEPHRQYGQPCQDCVTRAQELRKQQDLAISLENNLRQVEARIDDNTTLLNQRTSELRYIQSFFPMTDSISGSELKQEVVLLNDKIMQQAAVIARSLETSRRSLTAQDSEENREWSTKLVGQRILDRSMVELLRAPNVKSYHVQIALRAALVHATWMVITSIDPQNQQLMLMTQLFDGISQTEHYPIAARWRAISHAQICRTTDLKSAYSPVFTGFVTTVLAVAGWGGEAQQFNCRFDHLIGTAIKLNKIVMQQVFTMQVKVLEVPAETPFASITMEEEGEESNPERPGSGDRNPILVTCTTGLGLAYSLVDMDSSSSKWEYVLKTRVVTPKMLDLSPTRPQSILPRAL
ncbi:hypothetical protein BDN72DRAFT_275625 [Pluteus cervinus]|uniref:Uncharacterized protein n=1 Tax=Pluteus cervinus TaxID=181527 RepID=A0ACD3AFH7_9AGAR|nr:hypothetical protein BDN72DRAFT_275625 [Pluteus cervinus]